jgi:hypothetical protein
MTLCTTRKGTGNNFVSNAVSIAKKLVRSMANLRGQRVLRFRKIWTSESTGEQEIWA